MYFWSKILAKAEASQKRKASTSGATLSHVAKRTRSALAQSSGSTTRPSFFVGDSDDENDGDDDACGGSSVAPTAEGSNTKGIMADDAATSSVSLSRLWPSSGPVPSFKDVFGDSIHDALYRPTFEVLTKEVFKDLAVCKTIVDQFPSPGKIVQVESLSDDQLTTKMSMLYCMMMSHGGELLARYRGLNQSHQDYVFSADSRLKGYEEKVASLTGLELQVSTLKKQVSGLNDKLYSSDASFAKSKAKEAEKDEEGELLSLAASAGFERGLSMHQTKDEFAAVLKKMANFMLGTQDRLAEASPLLA
ncbi:hypothetical protein Tco_0779802 [Tanacetum coccineum]